MATALLVDDETLTRQGIRNGVVWKELGVNQVLEARNGLEALQVLKQRPLDILLTDVRMPRMDGVRLAREIRQRYPECAILFISGYSDEAYLRTAIDVKAVQYINKPIDMDSLRECLGAVVRRQEEERRFAQQVQLANRMLLATLMCSPLAGAEQIAQAMAMAGMAELAECPASCVLLQPPCQCAQHGKWQSEPLPGSGFFGQLAGQGARLVYCAAENGTVSGFVFHQGGHDHAWLLLVLREAMDQLPPGSFVALGEASPSPGQAARSHASALEALSLQFYRQSGEVLLPGAAAPDSDIMASLAGLEGLLRQGDGTGVRAKINAYCHMLADTQPPPATAIAGYQYAAQLLAHFMHPSIAPHWHNPAYTSSLLSEAKTLDDAGKLLDELLDMWQSGNQKGQANHAVEAAIQIILREQGNPDLSITMLCERLGVSAPHLCYLFKQQNEDTINQYINKVRMATACSLLENTGMKVHEVARACGFNGTNYFTRAFKKHVGTLPTLYRGTEVRP